MAGIYQQEGHRTGHHHQWAMGGQAGPKVWCQPNSHPKEIATGGHGINSSCSWLYRIDQATGGQFSDKRNHVLELCLDGVQGFDRKQHTMLPVAIRSCDIPFSHRDSKVIMIFVICLHQTTMPTTAINNTASPPPRLPPVLHSSFVGCYIYRYGDKVCVCRAIEQSWHLFQIPTQ